jgi:cysteine desulfurase
MMKVYLDHNSTTPLDPQVLESMMPYLREEFGNASSIHQWGRRARAALEDSRDKIATLLGAEKDCVVFTGGGTEADNLAIKGVAWANQEKGKHIVTSTVEHHAVLHTCEFLAKQGFAITFLPVDGKGRLDPDDLRKAIRSDTILITLMQANNETGTLWPLKEFGQIAKEKKVFFHTDAIQSFCKVPLNVEEGQVDLLSLSAHKIYGPKGVGALYIRKGTKMVATLHGGSQERKRRPGTENVAGAVGFARAAELLFADMEKEGKRLASLRDRLQRGLTEKIPQIQLNGDPENRLPGTLNMSFEFVEGESLILSLDMEGIAVSSGSACTSGSLEPSHVLLAMGIPHEVCHGSLRFSLGRGTTGEQIDYVLEVLPRIVTRLRAMSPLART